MSAANAWAFTVLIVGRVFSMASCVAVSEYASALKHRPCVVMEKPR